MRRLSTLLLLGGGLVLSSCSSPTSVNWGGSNTSKTGGKVTLCHEGKTIRVDGDAVRDHLRHGDQRGACR